MLSNIKITTLSLLIFITVAISFGAFIKNGFSILSPKKPSERLKIAFDRCVPDRDKTLSSIDYVCLSRELKPQINRDTLGSMIDGINELFAFEESSLNLGIPGCHLPAHLMGSLAINQPRNTATIGFTYA